MEGAERGFQVRESGGLHLALGCAEAGRYPAELCVCVFGSVRLEVCVWERVFRSVCLGVCACARVGVCAWPGSE